MPTAEAKAKQKQKPTLSKRQRAFCEEYVVDFNATKAAIRAGYAKRSASVVASQTLTIPKVQDEIARLNELRGERIEVTVEFVIQGLLDNFRRAMQAVPVTTKKGKPTGVYQYNGAVANRSLELLGKHLGMFLDRQEVKHDLLGSPTVLIELLAELEANRRKSVIDANYIESKAKEAQ